MSIVYAYLIGAISLEACGTMMLPMTENFTKPLPSVGLVVFCFVLSDDVYPR